MIPWRSVLTRLKLGVDVGVARAAGVGIEAHGWGIDADAFDRVSVELRSAFEVRAPR